MIWPRLPVQSLPGSWDSVAQTYGLNLQVVNKGVDPTFRFMRVDHDIRLILASDGSDGASFRGPQQQMIAIHVDV